jgi:hypothetical protein
MRGRRAVGATGGLALLLLAGCGPGAASHPTATSPGGSSTPGVCRIGPVRLVVPPEDTREASLCLRPYATLVVVLLPRPGSRWTSLTASGPTGRAVRDWKLGPDGTATVRLTVTGGAGTTLDAYGTGSTGPLWTMTLGVEPVPQPT